MLGGAVTVRRWRPFRVEIVGDSMHPALEDGEWALALRSSNVERGDVVVLEHPDRVAFELVKRVTAMGGDVAPDGRVLGEDAVWVEGDASDASTDSRVFGPVDRSALGGRVVLVYHPVRHARVVARGAVAQVAGGASRTRPLERP